MTEIKDVSELKKTKSTKKGPSKAEKKRTKLLKINESFFTKVLTHESSNLPSSTTIVDWKIVDFNGKKEHQIIVESPSFPLVDKGEDEEVFIFTHGCCK